VRVTNLLENVLTLYQRKTKTLGVEVERKYSYEGVVTGSPGELRQVFSNLIVNAMDALATTGDRLVLRVRRARRWDTGEQGVRVSIIDNGPGIPPEQRQQLFQAFYTTKGEQGTGIGLWISRTIVKKHGGTLRIHSSVRPGRSGTCFSVFLPLGSIAQTADAA
jgi:signal transduction histidine kinase